MVSYPQYNLDLNGWNHQSIWGWDPATDSFYAQLTRNGSGRDAEAQGPEIWLSPPWCTTMPTPAALTEAVAETTGCGLDSAQAAMNESLPDSGHPHYQHPPRRTLAGPVQGSRPRTAAPPGRRLGFWASTWHAFLGGLRGQSPRHRP